MAGTNSRLLPTIVNDFFSSSGFRNAVGLFITKQQAENLAKEEAERVFCTTLIESEQKSNRKTLTKQELTSVNCYQQCSNNVGSWASYYMKEKQ